MAAKPNATPKAKGAMAGPENSAVDATETGAANRSSQHADAAAETVEIHAKLAEVLGQCAPDVTSVFLRYRKCVGQVNFAFRVVYAFAPHLFI